MAQESSATYDGTATATDHTSLRQVLDTYGTHHVSMSPENWRFCPTCGSRLLQVSINNTSGADLRRVCPDDGLLVSE